MAATLYPPTRPQSVGEILDAAFRIFGTTLLKCLPYAALAVIAGQMPTLYEVASGRSLVQTALAGQHLRDPVWWLLEILALGSTLVLTNALLLRQYALATGGPAATATELARAVRLVPGVLWIWILVLGASVFPLGVVAGILVPAMRGVSSGAVLLLVLIFLGLIILASLLLVRWSCALTVYITTDRGAVESMSHSWALTSGNFWRLSLIYTVALVLILVLYVLSGVISGILSLLVARGDVAVITATAAVVVVLLGALATPFYTALALAVLGDLSVRREGADLAQRISAAPAS